MDRGAETIRCLLAVLKAGGAYLPLDPSLPGTRLAQMREEAGVRFVLTDSISAPAFAGGDGLILPVDKLAAEIASYPVSVPAVSLRPANLAYAIWTSDQRAVPRPSRSAMRRSAASARPSFANMG